MASRTSNLFFGLLIVASSMTSTQTWAQQAPGRGNHGPVAPAPGVGGGGDHGGGHGPGPQPQPQPNPQPPPVDNGEIQCQNQIGEAQQNLGRCEGQSEGLRQDQREASERLDRVNDQWQQAMQPVLSCRREADSDRAQLASINASISQEASREQAARVADQAIQSQLDIGAQLLAGKTIVCTVVGRNASFSAEGASAAQALQVALARCGQNNCGKDDWAPKFSCDIKSSASAQTRN